MLRISRTRPNGRAVPATPAAVLDRRGYRRSVVTTPEYRRGKRPPNAGLKLPIEVLTPDEVFRLLEACKHGRAWRRNQAMLTIMWRAGLRCAEMLALTPKDLDLAQGRVQVLHGKGNKRRVVALDPGAVPLLEPWLDERRLRGFNSMNPLFCVTEGPTAGLPVGSTYIRALMKELGDRAGIEKRVHPHGLRHTYASWLAEQSVPSHHIRRMLGHSSLQVTERYLDHLNPFEVIEAVKLVSWPEPPASSELSSRRL